MFHRSDFFFLGAAFLSFLLSVYLWFSGQREEGMFVGIWVPSNPVVRHPGRPREEALT